MSYPAGRDCTPRWGAARRACSGEHRIVGQKMVGFLVLVAACSGISLVAVPLVRMVISRKEIPTLVATTPVLAG